MEYTLLLDSSGHEAKNHGGSLLLGLWSDGVVRPEGIFFFFRTLDQ